MDNIPFDKEFLATFRAEAKEKLSNLSDGLLALECSADDEECIKTLFREAHTLKGSAGMMGLTSIRSLAHRIEDILSSVQKGQLELNQGVTNLLLETIDRIEAMLPTEECLEGPDEDISDLMDRLGVVDECEEPTNEKSDIAIVEKGKTSEVPPVDEKKDKDLKRPDEAEIMIESAGQKEEEIQPEQVTAKRQETEPKAGPKPAPVAASKQNQQQRNDPTIRVNIDRLDKLLNLMGEIIVNQIGTEGQIDELAHLQGKSHELKALFSSITEQIEDLRSRVPADEVESLTHKINKAGDTANVVADALDEATSSLKESTSGHKLALKELHDSTLNVRMLPLSTIFGLYPRVVRDASISCGKKVKLEIRGEKTELDKRILEQISDPLLHIIRNSVDHGIELPDDRIQMGKPEQGVVRLYAEQRGDVVDVIIEDDGAGINPEKIKASAVESGLISASDEVTIDSALDLIFRPGFSTAETVTDISGRGVGMDVVKNNIEKLEGSVAVSSVPGEGTRFVVSLPVTLVVISGLLVEAQDTKFVVPVSSVKEMVAIPCHEIQTLGNRRGFLMRETAIPLVDLQEALGGEPAASCGDSVRVIIVGSDRHQMGLQVERLIGEREVVIKPVSDFFSRHPYVGGVSILASGEIVVVLNANEMVSALKQGTGILETPARAAAPDEVYDEKKAVLVVEDSLVVRELQRNILEAAGYEVETAVDGQDALEHLREGNVDCVVTDIKMPGMDGFDLTSAIRKSEELRELPVIMVTSLNSDDDKRKGIEVGADAYVLKGSFNQQNLLDTIERLVA